MDLDRLRTERAAKREAEGKPTSIEVILGGRTFTLPPEMPAEAAMLASTVAEDDIAAAGTATLGAMKLLLGDQYEDFMALSPSLEDLDALFTGMTEAYGLTMGEPSASES